MAPLPAEQHRGLLTMGSVIRVSCLFLFASFVAGQKDVKITGRKPIHQPVPKDKSHKNLKKSGQKVFDIDSMKNSNGLPAVWYGPTKFTKQEQIQEQILDETLSGFIQFGSNKSARTRAMDPAWDKLGRYFIRSETIVMGRVDCRESPELCKLYKITRYPTLRYFKMGSEHHSDSLRYHGNHKYDNLKAFSMRELGGTPENCPFNIKAMEEHKEQNPDFRPEGLKEGKELSDLCTPLEKQLLETHFNKTYPKILSIIQSLKRQERMMNDKIVFPMKMSRLKQWHKDRLKANPEKKAFLDKEFESNKTRLEKFYIEDRIKKCRFIRTIRHVIYYNQMIHRSWKEEGIGSGLPTPSEEWIHWTKYQNKKTGGNKIWSTHLNGTAYLESGTLEEDIVFEGDENIMPYLEGVDEFLDIPAFNGPKSQYPEKFPEYSTTETSTPAALA